MKTTHLIKLAPLVCLFVPFANTSELSPDLPSLWKQHCTKCHASDGSGKTKAGRKLRVRNYRDATVQAEMKDEEMIVAIKEGVFKKNEEVMEGYSDKLGEQEILGFVDYIRGMRQSE